MPSQQPQHFRIEHAVLSDIGMRRANNQDSAVAVLGGQGGERRGSLFVVADGMGAHAAGELASKMAVDHVPHEYHKLSERPAGLALRKAVQKANSQIHAKGQSDAEFRGMGTTCTSLAVIGDQAIVAHIGDSRVYRCRGEAFEQLTFDHSLVWELAAASQTSADDVPSCIPKNVITRSLGPHPVVNVDLEGPFDLESGDTFVLCSDGLTGVVNDALIGTVVASMPPGEAARTLVDLANLRGGPDNISVIVVQVVADDSAPPPREGAPDRIGWLAWMAAAVCLAVVVWCVQSEQTLGAVLAAIGMGGALVRAMARPRPDQLDAANPTFAGSYGNGPYRHADCGPGEASTARLDEVIAELRELRENSQGRGAAANVDWDAFEADCQRAESSEDWRQRVAHYATAVRGMMAQVRREPELAQEALGAPPSDSALE